MFLLSTDKQVHVNIGTAQFANTQNEKLLCVTIDSKLFKIKALISIFNKSAVGQVLK